MGFKELERSQHISGLMQSWDEFAMIASHCLRRFKADDGLPIINAEEMVSMELQREEEILVKNEYDRFSIRIASRDPQ